MNQSILTEYRKFATELAKNAGSLVKKHFEQKLDKIKKDEEGRDFVTKADLELEKLIINNIKKEFPDHNILAEESNSLVSPSGFTWIIDPLDGTTNFSRNLPFFTISIALAKNDKVILGVVYNPINDELFYAEKGNGAFLNLKRIIVSKNNSLSQSIISQSFDYSNEKRKDNIQNIQKIFFLIDGFRLLHSTALELCYVASGRYDGYIISSANPWDIAAGALIVEEAGGSVTKFNGAQWELMRPRIVATNGLIHEELLKKINT